MWARNLLLLGLCLAGVGVLASNLAPSKPPPQWQQYRPGQALQNGEAAVVEQLDLAMQQEWQELKVVPAPRADDLALARRLSLALTGTIPSLEEIRLFQSRPAEERVDWWTAGLLADRRSSVYLAERFARAFVGVNDGPFLLYRRNRFVTWLAEEIHQNRPYDELVRSIIASEGLWTSEPATNFITAAIKPDSDDGVQENVMASRVSRAFLGVRLDCAECHDHPFNPEWSQLDFHRLAAFFGPATQSFTGIRDVMTPGQPSYEVRLHATDEPQAVEPAVPFQPELLPTAGGPRQQLAQWVTAPQNKAVARATVNRVWALMFGKPLVEPIDNIPTDEPLPPAMDLLTADFVESGYDLQRLFRTIAASRAFRLDSAAAPDAAGEITEDCGDAWGAFPITRLRPEQVVGSVLQATSVETIDHESHIVVRLQRAAGLQEFVKRYGDTGEDEFGEHGGTIPQRLLLMNGNLVHEKLSDGLLNATVQVARSADSDAQAVEVIYLMVLSRLPSAEETLYFEAELRGTQGDYRDSRVQDIFWTLINSTEFSWNH